MSCVRTTPAIATVEPGYARAPSPPPSSSSSSSSSHAHQTAAAGDVTKHVSPIEKLTERAQAHEPGLSRASAVWPRRSHRPWTRARGSVVGQRPKSEPSEHWQRLDQQPREASASLLVWCATLDVREGGFLAMLMLRHASRSCPGIDPAFIRRPRLGAPV